MALLGATLIWLTMLAPAWAAGSERYDYDGLGRLVRVISGDGTVTEYTYDPAGNITAVTRGAAAQPPTLANASPSALRRGSQVRVLLTGSNLGNAALQADDRELTISRVTRTAGTIEFDLAASAQATLGSSSLRVSSAAGTATLAITVRPKLPTVEVTPLPIAVPPDGRSATITIALSNADDQAHTIALSTAQPGIATVSPATVTIAQGGTRAAVQVAGVANGNTQLRLQSATLGDGAFPIFVLEQFEGLNTAIANRVGVVREGAAQPPSFAGILPSVPVGVVVSNLFWGDTQPRFAPVGSTATLVLTGSGLTSALAVSVQPPEDISVGSVVAASDGKSAEVRLTVAPGAGMGLRRLTLTSGATVLTPLAAGADQIDIVAPVPEIVSIRPILVSAGTTVPSFEILGRNLQDVTSVQVLGGGVSVSSSVIASPDGTSLRTSLQVAAAANAGPRTVVVLSPAGSSSTAASLSNTLTVAPAGDTLQTYPEVLSAVVGLQVGASQPPPKEVTYDERAPSVGVAIGPLVTGSAPATIARTEAAELVIEGHSLGSVSAVALTPATGLVVAAPVVSADGRRVSVQVSAAADAPLGPRRVDLLINGTPVAGSASLSLLVTLLTPVIDSITPNSALPTGGSFGFTLRGRNLQGATSLRFTPSTGITVGALSVDSAGTQITATVTVAAGAPLGARTVSVITPAGESSSVAGPNNRFVISGGPALRDLSSAIVGISLGTSEPYHPGTVDALISAPSVGLAVGELGVSRAQTTVASNVGVMLGQIQNLRDQTVAAGLVGVVRGALPDPGLRDLALAAVPVGVAFGPTALSIEPAAWIPGQTGDLVVRGQNLPAGTTVQLLPLGAATISGAATVDADGRTLRQRITIAEASPLTRLHVVLADPAGKSIPFAGLAGRDLLVLPGVPDVISIDPILAFQGDPPRELLIRGLRLTGAAGVAIEPADGIELAPEFLVNSAGTELRIQIRVRDNAPPVSRVVRVLNALGGSAAAPSPANTFTVYPKQ